MAGVLARPTLIHHLVEHAHTRPNETAVLFRRRGATIVKSWADVSNDVRRAAGAMRRLGVQPGERVALIAPNRYEWLIVDLAVLAVGATHVTLHATLSGPQMRFQIADADVRLVLVAGDEQIVKLDAAPLLQPEPIYAALEPTTAALHGRPVPQAFDLEATAENESVVDRGAVGSLREACAVLRPEQAAAILYTSGTTGDPKGVVLAHANLVANAEAIVDGFRGPTQDAVPHDRRLNLLPLSHIFARTCDLYCWLVGGGELALADSPQTAVADCGEFQPTILNAVPYFYERAMRRVVESGAADLPGMLPKIFGGRLRHACSGGAPLPDGVAKFFNERGVRLTQGYGLTETSPVITMNVPHAARDGTVGRPPRGVEVRIAADGEVLTRGPHVMSGYWRRPDETSAVLLDGWFHTGDLGELDADGYLRITGRKKELIVTTGGKKIVPSVVEGLLTADPLVRQVVVVGDGRDYLGALVVPDAERLSRLAAELGLANDPFAAPGPPPLDEPRLVAAVAARLQTRLAHLSHYEQVRKVVLLSREFSVEREELTLTMKLRRERIAANFAAEIARLYAS